jgi:hypothetical protein
MVNKEGKIVITKEDLEFFKAFKKDPLSRPEVLKFALDLKDYTLKKGFKAENHSRRFLEFLTWLDTQRAKLPKLSDDKLKEAKAQFKQWSSKIQSQTKHQTEASAAAAAA